jgi:hydrophobic/amphiphilic exporter-1 (mainly G- bacteria), HAE1 family
MKLDRLLPELSLRRPVTVLMIFIALLMLGWLAFQRIPYEMMPRGFTSLYMGFWVPYPDSTPSEIEKLVARPFEENLRTVHGMKYMESYSQTHGCWIWMEMREGVDMDQAWSQVRDRIDRSLAESSVDIERVVLRKMGMDDEEVYWLGISSEIDISEARILIEENLLKPLERVDGVAKVDLWGGDSREVLVDLDLDAMGRHGINSYQVVQTLSDDNFAISCGRITDGDRRLNLRVDSRWQTVAEIARIPISNYAGMSFLLSDIAHVHIGAPEVNRIQRIDRKAALMMGVSRESTANTEELCRRIDEILAAAGNDPKLSDLRISKLFSQGQFIRESIDNLKESGIWGGLFALLILFFFLRKWTPTIIITAAIPFCIFIATTVIYFMGWTLNIITMMGLMISVGMVVDNAIVVMESISITPSTKGKGLACVDGAAEVSLAVTVATLTSIVVFLPLMLMSGDSNLSFFLQRIGMPVVVSLLASLIVALLFIPQLSSRLPRSEWNKEPRLIRMARGLATKMLAWTLRRRVDATIIALACLMSMQFPMQMVEKVGDGDGNVNDFQVILDMPSSYNMEQAGELVNQLEGLLYEREDQYRLKTVTSRYSNSHGRIHVWLQNDGRVSWYTHAFIQIRKKLGFSAGLGLSRDETIENFKELLPETPGVDIRIGWNGASNDKSITVLLRGHDTDVLKPLADEARRRIDLIDGVAGSEIDVERGDEELRFELDRDALSRYGLNAGRVASTIRASLSGARVGYLQQSDRDIRINVRLQEGDRDQLHKLQELEISTETGQMIPISQFVDVKHGKSLGTIRRSQGQTFMRIKVYANDNDMDSKREQIKAAFSDFGMPTGYSWSLGRGFNRFADQQQEQNNALLLAVCFVFLLMGMLFESFSIPFTVLASIPFAFFGAWWILYITGTPFDIMAGIGLIILVGVVVNNAIVLLDYVVRLRKSGMSRNDALLEAVSRRFRPVMMTAATTICGLIPMAIGNAALVGMPYAPMGRAMAGGLITSTFFTLMAVPLLYTWIDDASIFVNNLASRVFHRKKLLQK